MTEMENVVYQVLCHWRVLKVDDHPSRLGKNGDEQAKSRHENDLYYIVSNIAKWMSQLSEDERYVLKRHLIDGASWKKVRWEFCKDRRREESLAALRRMQERAITQIAQYADRRY